MRLIDPLLPESSHSTSNRINSCVIQLLISHITLRQYHLRSITKLSLKTARIVLCHQARKIGHYSIIGFYFVTFYFVFMKPSTVYFKSFRGKTHFHAYSKMAKLFQKVLVEKVFLAINLQFNQFVALLPNTGLIQSPYAMDQSLIIKLIS